MLNGQVKGQNEKMARTKTNRQNSTKHAEQQEVTNIKKKFPFFFHFFF